MFIMEVSNAKEHLKSHLKRLIHRLEAIENLSCVSHFVSNPDDSNCDYLLKKVTHDGLCYRIARLPTYDGKRQLLYFYASPWYSTRRTKKSDIAGNFS